MEVEIGTEQRLNKGNEEEVVTLEEEVMEETGHKEIDVKKEKKVKLKGRRVKQ